MELQHVQEEPQCMDDNHAGGSMQEKASSFASGLAEFGVKLSKQEHKEEEVAPVLVSFQQSDQKADQESEGSIEEHLGTSKLNIAHDKKEWELDKNLPPIKTRRDTHSECSPSELSPPSPKRMRQESLERKNQWERSLECIKD